MNKPSQATRSPDPFPPTPPIIAAAQGDTPAGRHARSELCKLYWRPLYVVARSRGHSVDKASDLTQGFFTRFLSKNDVAAFKPERGPFRKWLRRCFLYYTFNWLDHEKSIGYGGGVTHVPIDTVTGERCYQVALAHQSTPEALFDRCYTITLLDRALGTLRGEWARKGKARQFSKLKDFITYEDNQRYKDIAEELETSLESVKTMVFRLRQRFAELLRSEVAQTVERPEDVDAELLELLQALADKPEHPLQVGSQCIVSQPC